MMVVISITGVAVSRGKFSTDILFSFLPQISGVTIELLIEARTSQGDELSITMQMWTIQEINISCVPTSTSNVSITGLVSLSWEAVAAACCRQWGLELRFFLSCCLLSWDQSAHLTRTQLALAVTTDLLPLQIDELVMIQKTLSTWSPGLVVEY